MNERDEAGFRIAGPAGVAGLIDRMARHVTATVPGDPRVVGIRRRGVPLAERLSDRVAELSGERPAAVQEIDLKRYADDLSLLHQRPDLGEPPDLDVEGEQVVVVDDVLYTGRTQLRAVELLAEAGAAGIHPAVLCSRGAGEVPIHAHVVGLQLDVGEENVIEVHVPPYEERAEILLYHRKDQTEGD